MWNLKALSKRAWPSGLAMYKLPVMGHLGKRLCHPKYLSNILARLSDFFHLEIEFGAIQLTGS